MSYIICAKTESLIKKNRWMCKQSQKIIDSKNRQTWSLQIFDVKLIK